MNGESDATFVVIEANPLPFDLQDKGMVEQGVEEAQVSKWTVGMLKLASHQFEVQYVLTSWSSCSPPQPAVDPPRDRELRGDVLLGNCAVY